MKEPAAAAKPQSQPQPQPKSAPKPMPKPVPMPAPTQPAAAAKLQARYKQALLRAATGGSADIVHQQTEVRVMPSCMIMYSNQAVDASNILIKAATVCLIVILSIGSLEVRMLVWPACRSLLGKKPTATVKVQVNKKEEAVRAAMGSPALAAQETAPQHSQPSAGSKVADKSTGADLLHQQTEVHLVPSCDLMDSRQAFNTSNVLMRSTTVR